MLVIYNENSTPWLRANINDKTSKFTATRTLPDNTVRYLDILISNELETPDMGSFVEMTNCVVINDDNTSLQFKKKDLKPFITKSDRYNTDIILINITLKGKIIKDISGDRSSVIGYLIAKGELFLIMSVRDGGSELPSFKVTLHDPHLVADTIYTFAKDKVGYTLNREDVQVDTVIDKPTFKINHFRPNKPTHVIFTAETAKTKMRNLLKNSDKHEIIEYNNLNDLASKSENLKKTGYKAVTLFIEKDTFNGTEDTIYGRAFTTLKNNFKIVNVLTSTGKTLRR